MELGFSGDSDKKWDRKLAVRDASRLIVQSLERLCAHGHAMAAESAVLSQAEHRSRLARTELLRALRYAIQQGHTAREQIENIDWLFPRAVRDAELVVAQRIRHLAEGPPMTRSERARLEKVSLVCSSAPLGTIDIIRTMLIRLNRMSCWPTLLVAGAAEAQWYRWKLGRPVIECGEWLRCGSPTHSVTSQAADRSIIILLDASRLGIESMAETLEAIPQASGLILVGNPDESPKSGHGQPFRDLLSTALFQTVQVDGITMGAENRLTTAPSRRSALYWRLRRGAGLKSNLRWGPIATIQTKGDTA